MHFLPPILVSLIGLGSDFVSKKFCGIDLERFPLFLEESAHSEAFRVPRKSYFRSSERNGMVPVHQKSSFLLRFVLNCFLFRGMVRNGIPRVSFYFCSTEWNSELCSLPRNGSEWNSKSLLLVLFHGMGFGVVFSSIRVRNRIMRVCFYFCSTERNSKLFSLLSKGSECKGFSFPRNSRNSVGNNYLVCLFRLPRNYFFVGNS
jgi:hypothetical protein